MECAFDGAGTELLDQGPSWGDANPRRHEDSIISIPHVRAAWCGELHCIADLRVWVGLDCEQTSGLNMMLWSAHLQLVVHVV